RAGPADRARVGGAVTNRARAGLVSSDPASAARTVRMHPSVQAAVRAYLPPADFEQAVLAAAEALLQAWPEADGGQDPRDQVRLEQARLQQALRGCTSALWAAAAGAQAAGPRHAQDEPGPEAAQARRSMLWQPEAHPLLFRKGLSLEASGLAETAFAYWQAVLLTSTRLLGSEHANAVTARERLGSA